MENKLKCLRCAVPLEEHGTGYFCDFGQCSTELKDQYEPDGVTLTGYGKTLKPAVPGVGPDAPTTTNADGGKQSATLYRADLLPPTAVLSVAKILKHGADKYGAENWRLIPRRDNLNHALIHVYAYLAGDRSDDHLEHAACRLLFALETADSPPVPAGTVPRPLG